jgi:hypothetical protein
LRYIKARDQEVSTMDANDVRQKVNTIAAEGENVTERVREVVVTAARSMGEAGKSGQQRLSSLVSATMEGASGAVSGAAPERAESTLRQVLDGLGAGLQRTANATRLAVEESASTGKAYAAEDLSSIAEDFRTLGDMFTETVEKHTTRAAGQTSEQIDRLSEHARHTMESVRPSLESAIDAALKDPIGLADESADAAISLARQTAGSLFGAVGKALGEAGERISPQAKSSGHQPTNRPEDPGKPRSEH